jgi:hypothetical protein
MSFSLPSLNFRSGFHLAVDVYLGLNLDFPTKFRSSFQTELYLCPSQQPDAPLGLEGQSHHGLQANLLQSVLEAQLHELP